MVIINCTTTDYDKMRGLWFDEPQFKFVCPYCQNKHINLIPFNMSWKTNSDNTDLPLQFQKGYDSLPSKFEAVLLGAQQNDIFFECVNCGQRDFIIEYVDRLKLIKWLQSKNNKENDGKV